MPTGDGSVDFPSTTCTWSATRSRCAPTLGRAEHSSACTYSPMYPDWIPYRTSYYERSWGFCMSARALRCAARGTLPDRSAQLPRSRITHLRRTACPRVARGTEVLFFTHICHPSLANDNTSGMAVATALAEWIAGEPRRFTLSIRVRARHDRLAGWLKANQARLRRIRHGLVLALLGDPSQPHLQGDPPGGSRDRCHRGPCAGTSRDAGRRFHPMATTSVNCVRRDSICRWGA